MRNKTFYSAYTCRNNLGDLIINKMQIEEYSKYGVVYVDFTGMPENFRNIILGQDNPNVKDFMAEYGMSYRGCKFLGVIRFLRDEGFTHLTKSPGPYAVLSLPLKTLAVRLAGALGYWMAARMGMKVFALGIDLDYNTHQPKWLRWLNVKYFSSYDVLGVRSVKNRDMCSENLNNVTYVPDMAFLYTPRGQMDSVRRYIAFSFRKVSDVEELVDDLRQLLSVFVPAGYFVDLICQVEEDLSFARLLKERLKGYDLTISSHCLWYDKLDAYMKYDYVFSNRLHVLLLASIHGSIPLALISSNIKEQKIANVFNGISLESLVRYIGKGDGNQWEVLLSDRESIRSKVNIVIETQKRLCSDFIRDYYQRG